MQSGMMDTMPSDKILHCLQQLTEMRDYIKQREYELMKKEKQFRLEMQQKEFDLKCAKSTPRPASGRLEGRALYEDTPELRSEDTSLNRTFPTPSTTLACISTSEMRTPH